MKKLLIPLFSILISFNALSIEIDYIYYKNDPSRFDDYLRGLESGVGWSIVANEKSGSEVSFYCQPSTVILNIENLHVIISKAAEQIVDNGVPQSEVDEMPVAMIFVYGLKETFPCN